MMHARLPQQSPLSERAAGTSRRPSDPVPRLADLQRSFGNAAVSRALTGALVQRYAEPDAERDITDTASYDRISENGKIAVSGRQEAFAEAELIASANAALAASEQVRIRLEAGREVVVGGRVLRRVLPVFASREAAEAAQANSEHEPLAGESAEERATKLDSYRRSVVQPPAALGLLLRDIARLTGGGRPSDGSVNGVHQRLLALAMENQGATWAAENVPLNPLLDPVDYLKTAGRLIGVIVMEYADSREPERVMQDLLITMPNDCQAAAQRLLGTRMGELQQAPAEPSVGQNHYVNLSDAPGRWNNHFGAVIMRDGDDTLTFEAAADSTSRIGEGKSLGYFALYGKHGTSQSFDADLRRQNAAGAG
ncbi:hypothetical protein [Streptomyces sp. SID9124]|uniref:hypothetical protein n=1 Tax=Streptomyces sp. SID9124 TaxID=2706108 RepID=UPI0013E0DCB8|nr:hypothetical protein [Streptomyces sp. SID9124]NED13882.1 hypothetical protein [Streptomyces sp. SID9124]